jgi:hypothetical protein
MVPKQLLAKNTIQPEVLSESCQLIHQYLDELKHGGSSNIEKYILMYTGNKDAFIRELCFADFIASVLKPDESVSEIPEIPEIEKRILKKIRGILYSG